MLRTPQNPTLKFKVEVGEKMAQVSHSIQLGAKSGKRLADPGLIHLREGWLQAATARLL